MTPETKNKIDSLARAILANPDKNPNARIAETCTTQEEHDYLEQRIEELEK